jgi:hypothetical protein
MTGAELDDLVAELQRSTPLGRIGPVAARMIFLQLLAVGYDLVKPSPTLTPLRPTTLCRRPKRT